MGEGGVLALLKHALRRLTLQEWLDEGMEQLHLADDRRMRRGRIKASRDSGSGSPMSPITPPPSSRNLATLCSRVEASASPAMINTGTSSAFDGPPPRPSTPSRAGSAFRRGRALLAQRAQLRVAQGERRLPDGTQVVLPPARSRRAQPRASPLAGQIPEADELEEESIEETLLCYRLPLANYKQLERRNTSSGQLPGSGRSGCATFASLHPGIFLFRTEPRPSSLKL